jgi:hypothetical protein
MTRLLPLLAAAACASPREDAEDWTGWYDSAEDATVEEAIAWTDQPYAFPADPADGIGAFAASTFPVTRSDGTPDTYTLGLGEGESFPDGAPCEVQRKSSLPAEIEGVVTLHPAWYTKVVGCNVFPHAAGDVESEEKYYSSYFLQDGTGGVFVLYDTRAAPFDVGDRVTIRVRAVKTAFSWDMVYAHDLVSVERLGDAVYYELPPTTPYADSVDDDYAELYDICPYSTIPTVLGMPHVNRVFRAEGTVVQERDDFGTFIIADDAGNQFPVSIALDLGRRPAFEPVVGDRLRITAPVIRGFDFTTFCAIFPFAITRVSQVELLEPASTGATE